MRSSMFAVIGVGVALMAGQAHAVIVGIDVTGVGGDTQFSGLGTVATFVVTDGTGTLDTNTGVLDYIATEVISSPFFTPEEGDATLTARVVLQGTMNGFSLESPTPIAGGILSCTPLGHQACDTPNPADVTTFEDPIAFSGFSSGDTALMDRVTNGADTSVTTVTFEFTVAPAPVPALSSGGLVLLAGLVLGSGAGARRGV